MKKLIIPILFIGVLFAGCKKEPDVVSQVLDATYPIITMNGPANVWIPVGGSFTEQGAVYTDNITGATGPLDPQESNVDPSTTGFYKVFYSYTNANGFRTKVYRTILVYDHTPPPGLDSTYDISGVYERTNGIVVNLYKMANGLYIIDNFGGSTTIIPAYMLTPDTMSIDIPKQTSFDGFELECINETFSSGPPITFSYRVDAFNFGTGVRTFIKQ